MDWLEWLMAVAGLLGLFVLWDLVFCGGRHCIRATGVALVLTVAAAVALTACSRTEQADDRGRGKPPMARVHVETVVPQAVPDTIEAVGTVRSRQQSVLSAKIVAVVVAVHAREGDRVTPGRLLVELDDRDAKAQLRRAEAALREARSGLDEADRAIEAADRAVDAARAQQEMAQVTHARYRQLLDRELIAAQDYDEAAARHRVATAELARVGEVKASLAARRQQALARIASSEAEMDAAAIVAGYARITAPGAGIVVAKTVEVGNLAAPGVPLLTLDEERYRLEATVQESDLRRLRLGQRADVAIDAVGRALAGSIAEIVPAADPVSRTFTVKIDLPALPDGVRSGLYGKAHFVVGERRALLVERAAVSVRGQLETVFVVDAGNVARLRLVKTGRAVGERVEILAGLGAGERVVGEAARVADGQPVETPR